MSPYIVVYGREVYLPADLLTPMDLLIKLFIKI